MERVAEYFAHLRQELSHSPWVIHHDLTFRQIDVQEGYLKGILYLHGGFTLHVAEYIEIRAEGINRPKYRYHLQDASNTLIARWDNAPHHQDVETTPFHKHCQDGTIVASLTMDIPQVLAELDDVLKEVG